MRERDDYSTSELGKHLVRAGKITVDDLAKVLEHDRESEGPLAGSLDFDETAAARGHHIHVDFCARILFVGEIESDLPIDDAHRNGCNRISQRIARELAEYLTGTLYDDRERFDLDILVLQNVLTIPMHIPLGVAVTEFLLETQMPAIAHHHDFYWERQRFQISAVQDYLEMAFPPRIPHLQHVVINQAAKDQLGWRKGISSLLIPNVLDYENPPQPVDDYASDVREAMGLEAGDLLILQPTRVIPRKGIEHAIHLLRRLKDPRCKLVISHDAGDEGLAYSEEILELARDEGVNLIMFGERVADRRQLNEDGQKKYVLEDLYPHADLVTFPSLYEGFGNALLEAIYFRKPVIIGNYSVYSSDIEPKGVRLPTIDGFIGRDLVEQARRVLEDAEYRNGLVEHNYGIAERYFSYRVLRDSLRLIVTNIRNLTE